MSRYYMILNRAKALTKKNKCYASITVALDREEFITWFMKNDYVGCSVDRIDSAMPYEFGNLQLISKSLNAAKDKIVAKDGYSICRSCGKRKRLRQFVKESRRIFVGYSTQCKACERNRWQER